MDFQWPVVMIYLLNHQMLNRLCRRVWGGVSVGVLKLADIQRALLPGRLGAGTAGGSRGLLLSVGQERAHSVCTAGRLPWPQQLVGCDCTEGELGRAGSCLASGWQWWNGGPREAVRPHSELLQLWCVGWQREGVALPSELCHPVREAMGDFSTPLCWGWCIAPGSPVEKATVIHSTLTYLVLGHSGECGGRPLSLEAKVRGLELTRGEALQPLHGASPAEGGCWLPRLSPWLVWELLEEGGLS